MGGAGVYSEESFRVHAAALRVSFEIESPKEVKRFMMPKTIENALANGYETQGQTYKEIVNGNTVRQTGVWELAGDNPEDHLEIPYTAVFRCGKPRQPRVSPSGPTFAFERKIEHPATRKGRGRKLPARR